MLRLLRGPVLAALVAGEAAEAFERQSAAAAVERVMVVLRRIYEPQGIHVPAPVQVTAAPSAFKRGASAREPQSITRWYLTGPIYVGSRDLVPHFAGADQCSGA